MFTIAAIRPEELPGAVAVVSGGRSRERDRSLLSGRTALDYLHRLGITARLLDCGDRAFPDSVRAAVVALLAVAGQHAEDGKLQGLLEHLQIPYTGSGVLASALAMHKPTAKVVVAAAGVPTMPGIGVEAAPPVAQRVEHVCRHLGLPIIVKPESEGGSIDVRVAQTPSELGEVLTAVQHDGQRVLAERFATGRSVTVGVLESEGLLWPLPPLEIQSPEGFYSFAAKRDPKLHHYVCPSGAAGEDAGAAG